jgi:glycosyltransferase involved in cell wall biosynthesis
MLEPRAIAVDLTPMLPGGENGGAKVFVLELLRRLAARHARTRFLLLTQSASHEELAALDGPNVERLLVAGAGTVERRIDSLLKSAVRRAAAALPRRIAIPIAALASRLRRGHAPGPSLRDRGVDLLFCPFTAPSYREASLPVVCTIYDLQYRSYPQFFRPEEVAHRDQTFRAAARHASVLVAISDYARDSAIDYGQIDPARIRTIHLQMAKRISRLDAARERGLLAGLGIEPGDYLLYPANFWRHKNHELLLAAFAMAATRGLRDQCKLVCTGAPNERVAWLRTAADGLGIGERVLFPGYVADEVLGVVLGNARGLVFPSLYEGFGLPVIEAMAAGVPVACSNSTSLPEVCAGAALLFDPRVPTEIADAMVRLDRDAEARAALVAAGLLRAQQFADTGRMADEYWDAFLFALANGRQANAVIGVFADGWAGARVNVEVAPGSAARQLELEFAAPDWLPGKSIQVVARDRSAKSAACSLKVAPGSSGVLALPVSARGASVDIRIAPSFVPNRVGIGDDKRELSLMLRRCSVAAAEGEAEILFPETSE